MAMYRSDQTRADAPVASGLQSHPLPGPPQHGPSSSSPSLQRQQVSFSSAPVPSSSSSSSSFTSLQPLPPLAMSIGTAPLPGAPVHLRGPPRLGQQQTTRTLQGPSAQDWARNRDIIVDLYRQYPLKKVSDIMRTQYNFSARYFGLPSVCLYLCTQQAPHVFFAFFHSTQLNKPTASSCPCPVHVLSSSELGHNMLADTASAPLETHGPIPSLHALIHPKSVPVPVPRELAACPGSTPH